MSDYLRAQIYSNLDSQETEDLLDIWQNGDPTEWNEAVFEIIKGILVERLGYLPAVSVQKQVSELLRNIDADFRAGKLEKALAECELVVQMTPNSALAYQYRGKIYEELEKLDDAMANYRVAIQLDPESRDAWESLLGIEEDLEGEFQTSLAKQHLDQALGFAYGDEPERGQQELELAKPLIPDIALAHNYLGLVLEILGQLELAANSYLKAIELNPRFYAARENLANARVKLGEEQFRLASIGAWTQAQDEGDTGGWPENAEASETSDHDAPLPEWLFMDEKAFLLIGWPGYRTRPGRTGYDPLERDFEVAHMQGTIIRLLMIRRFRTRNPVYLALMIYVGLIYCLPLLGIPALFQGDWALIQPIIFYGPYWIVGIALLINVFLSLRLEKSDEPDQGAFTFF